MAIASIIDFAEVLRASQLLEPEQLAEAERELEQGTSQQALLQRLIQRALLTSYQAEQLVRDNGQGLILGPYRLLEPIGEGGMGQVFKALHARLQRVVALKIIRPGRMAQDPETLRRFQREARAAALMVHPNVVMVYDADQVGETSFIALEYVEGVDLGKLVKDRGTLPVAQACDYIRQAALGLQHAHEHGMVHRDIKPSNLLVTRRPTRKGLTSLARPSGKPGAPAEDAPPIIKILDMGLVRMVQSGLEGSTTQASLTREGTVMGTPDYIAPEQARNAHRVDIRADIYSLGCTAYHLLAGQPPFPEGTVIEKLLMHQLDTPRPLEEIRPEVPPGVVAVVCKMMAKRREDRYQMPAEVAEALTAVLAKMSGAAPPPPRPAAAVRPPAKPTEPTPVPRPRATALPPPRPARAVSPTPVPRTSREEPSMCASTRKVTVVLETPAEPLPEETPQLLLVLKGQGGSVLSMAFSGDRDLLAAGGVDGVVRLADFSGPKPRERAAVATQRNSGTTGLSRTTSIAGAATQTMTSLSGHGIHSLAFSADNRMMASGSGAMDGMVRLWSLIADAPEEKAILPGHRSPVDAVAFAPDGKLLASGGNDRAVRIWDLAATPVRERALLRGHTGSIKTVAFAPDGNLLASGGQDRTVRLWQAENRLWPRERAVLSGHGGSVLSVAFTADGKTLASGSQDQTIRLWDLSKTQPVEQAVLEGHAGSVRQVLFPPGTSTLVSVDDTGKVIQWGLRGEKLRTWDVPAAALSSVALTVDGRYVAIGTLEGKVRIYRLGPKRRSR